MALEEGYVVSLSQSGALPPPEGTLFRSQSDATVYLVEGGQLHAMTFTAFQNRGFSFGSVLFVPDGEIGLYPIGNTYFQ